jgi:hypothetical protein
MEVGVASIDGRCAHPSNIKIQKAGAEGSLSMLSSLPASDLGVIRIKQSVNRMPRLVPVGSTMLE